MPVLEKRPGGFEELYPKQEPPEVGKKSEPKTPKRRILERRATVTFERPREPRGALFGTFSSPGDISRRQATVPLPSQH